MSINLHRERETVDGKKLVTSNALPEWCVLSQCGRGDDTKIGNGPIFKMSTAGPDNDSTLEFGFMDPVFVTSGVGVIQDAKLGDYIRFEVFAPPTVPTSASGDGNCNKVATGQGFNIIVPAGGDGSWNLPASESCHIVPNPTGEGYWDLNRDWSEAQIGPGTVTPNYTGEGEYDLYDTVGMHLSMFATDVPILGTDVVLTFGIQNVRAKMVPPQWHWKVTLHAEDDSHTVKVGFFLQMGRARTYLDADVPFVPT